MKTTSASLRALGAKNLGFALLALLPLALSAADFVKTNNATALDLADSWTNSLVPSATDIAIWDVNSGANSAPIGTGISIQGIRFDASTTGNQTINATGGGILTNGSAGIDLANSINTLAITSPIELNGNQTWKTETNGLLAAGTAQITYGGVISGTGMLTIDAGDKTVGQSAVTPVNTFSGGLVIKSGTFSGQGTNAFGVGTITLGDATGSKPATLYPNRSVDMTYTNIIILGNTAGTLSILSTRSSTAGHTLTGVISGSHDLTFGPNTAVGNKITLSGNNAATFFGNIIVTNSTLRLANGSAFNANNTLAIVTGGTVDLNASGSTWVFAGLSDLGGAGGTLVNAGGARTVKFQGGGNYSYSGAINQNINLEFGEIGNGTHTLSGSSSTYGGTTTVKGGVLNITGATANKGLITVAAGKLLTTTLSTNGHVTVSAGAMLGAKVAAAGSTLGLSNLTFAAGSTLQIDLSTLGNPSANVVSSLTNTVNGTVTVNLLGTKTALTTGSFTVLTNQARAGAGFYVLGTTPLGVSATLTDNGTNVIINIASLIPILTWTGTGSPAGNWDIGSSLNWLNESPAAAVYNESPVKAVLFNDSASGTPNVNLTTTLSPSSLNVSNASLAYNFSGSGKLSGSTGLTKEGAGTLTISTTNDYTGATTVNAGTLKLGAGGVLPDGSGKGNVTVNGTLDLAGFNETINGLSGSGKVNASTGSSVLTVGANDAASAFSGILTNSGGTLALIKSGTNALTLTGASTYSGGTTLNAGILSQEGGTAFVGAGGVLTSSVFGTGPLTINSGTLKAGALALFNPTIYINGNFTLDTTARDDFSGGFNLGGGTRTITLTRSVTAVNCSAGAGTASSARFTPLGGIGNNTFTNGTLRLAAAASVTAGNFVVASFGSSQGNRFKNDAGLTVGPQVYVCSSGTGFPFANNTTDLPNVTVEAGGYYSLCDGGTIRGHAIGSLAGSGTVLNNGTAGAGTGTLTIEGGARTTSSDFSGVIRDTDTATFTTANAALVTAITKNGGTTQILSGGNTYTGPTTVNGGTLLINGNQSTATGLVTVNSGGTLGGTGIIGGAVTNTGTGTIAPGAGGIGTLTINSNLTLGGNLWFEVNKSLAQSNDFVNVSGVLTNAGLGTLTVTNIGASALVVGDYFKLFSQAVSNGLTLTISGPANVTFTNNLELDGSISVLSVAAPTADYPTNITFEVIGGNLNLTWPGTHLGWYAQSNSLNLAVTNYWFDIANSQNGTNLTIPISPALTNVFYRLRHP